MEHTVEASWQLILDWFAEHCPAELTEFRGPVDEEALLILQDVMGRDLPADQLAWWRLSDGTQDDRPAPSLIPVGWTPASTAYTLRRYRMLTANLASYWPDLAEQDDEPAGTPTELPWLPGWLPIAHDLGGGHLFVDLRAGPAYGCVGEKDKTECYTGDPHWWSVSEMLDQIADALVNGTEIGGWHAVVENGRFQWDKDPYAGSGMHVFGRR